MDNIILTDVNINSGSILFFHNGPEGTEAWLENTNKHYPHILSLDSSSKNNAIICDQMKLRSFLEHYPGHSFKLSLCNTNKRLLYTISAEVIKKLSGLPCFLIKEGSLGITSGSSIEQSGSIGAEVYYEIQHQNKPSFINIDKLPINLLDIGSCFSRNIFRSDAYFNPTYKTYFKVMGTLFHDSFISLLSEPVSYDYTAVDDLISGSAGKYIGVEFHKNVRSILEDADCQIIVVDNYIDAAVPVIKFCDGGYLTYNKYFSESIFKRFFSSCEVLYPGSEEHACLYRKSLSAFHRLVDEYRIQNIVLIGGRLSRYKIDEETWQVEKWDDKMDWITEVNRSWDIADSLFLQEFPDAIYMDRHFTTWKSDINSPIIGGASPSHYQSGYYKELFEELLQFIRS